MVFEEIPYVDLHVMGKHQNLDPYLKHGNSMVVSVQNR